MSRITLKPREPFTAEDEVAYWDAVVRRDTAWAGQFVYAVSSTGIYCQPGCPSRCPERKNVRFFFGPQAAELAGFRPCKRCRPNATESEIKNAAAIHQACRLLENSDPPPGLAALAAMVGLSPSHLHRQFKAMTGMTPKAYGSAVRERSVRQALAAPSSSVTEAIYDAGYQSSSRFYEKSNALLGMTPTHYRRGGEGMVIKFAVAVCSLGDILVACSEKGVCAILLGDDALQLTRDLQDTFPKAEFIGADTGFEKTVAAVVGFVEAPRHGLQLPLDIQGTLFQQHVWQALQAIPAGKTVSYQYIAQHIGHPKAVRAVAQACAANLLAVAIPCHRVVRTDGSLSGYRWGVTRKQALLKKEQ